MSTWSLLESVYWWLWTVEAIISKPFILDLKYIYSIKLSSEYFILIGTGGVLDMGKKEKKKSEQSPGIRMNDKIIPQPEICIYIINEWMCYCLIAKEARYENDASCLGEVRAIIIIIIYCAPKNRSLTAVAEAEQLPLQVKRNSIKSNCSQQQVTVKQSECNLLLFS